jgi:hypothetical protein
MSFVERACDAARLADGQPTAALWTSGIVPDHLPMEKHR